MQPLRAFLLLLGLILVLTTVVALFLKEDPEPPVDEPKSTNFALTDTEALQRTADLAELSIQAIQHRDLSLLPLIYAPDGPAKKRATRDIRQLLTDRVLDRAVADSKDLEVVSNGPNEIRVRETLLLHPCFKTESGKDITQGPEAIEQVGLWILRRDGDKWLIHDAILEADRAVDKQDASCR
jgi:hypothetical protein